MSCIVYIGLGSNQENPARQVLSAMDEINQLAHVTVLTRSSLYQTKPWGMVDQPDFINAVIQCKTSLSPRALLEQLLLIEKSHGRVRKEKNGPRTLDCDILLYDNEALNEPGLEIPHPMITTRAFVLFPLAQIAPD
ncbi:MAG: 2-amino-4-hydroxy-6-hydroxymethyldihydropteridine diphosphokinase [Candidatus Berkiella sp.]